MSILNIDWVRGDTGTILNSSGVNPFVFVGDLTTHLIRFVVKADNSLTSARLIDKDFDNGTSNGITGSYDAGSNTTTFTVSLLTADTNDLSLGDYYFSLTDTLGSTISTPYRGIFKLSYDVETPFDGFSTPDTAVRFQQVDASSANVDDFVTVGLDANSDNIFKFTSILKASQFKLSALNTAPTSATDTGTLGEIRIDANYIYICTATNVWVRAALSTW